MDARKRRSGGSNRRLKGRRVLLNAAQHLALGVSLDTLNEDAAQRHEKEILDYWAWDHWIFPAMMYMYIRNLWVAVFIDWAWEIVERGTYTSIGVIKRLPMNDPDAWPDALRPESAWNSIMNDMPNGLCGILFAKLFVWAIDMPPLRGLTPYETDTETVLQLLILAASGAMSGSGFKRMYVLGGLEMLLFMLFNVFWNSDVSTVSLWMLFAWVGVMATTNVAATLARFMGEKKLREPIFTMYIAIYCLFLAVLMTGVYRRF